MKHLRNFIRLIVIQIKFVIFTKLYGMDIHPKARIGNGAKLDKTYPKGIHIDEGTYVGSGALIFSHDYCRGLHVDTKIGKRCFIGMNSIILPGITIGDHAIVGAGAVVTKNVPANTIVAGNPAKTIKENIMTGEFGKLID